MAFLITEITEEVEFVTESNSESGKNHYIVGRFIVGDEKNKNKRVYPMEDVLVPSVEKYIKEYVDDNRAYGELGHPSGPAINLDRVSQRIVELTRDGNAYNGKAVITNTPMGNTIKGLFETGGKLGVSTRGMGSLNERDGAMYVQKDFKLTAIDSVSDPSGPKCFVNGIMEGVEYFFDPIKGTWKEEVVDNMKKSVDRMSIREIEEKALGLFESYLSLLTSNYKQI
jgi:hypothetical protein